MSKRYSPWSYRPEGCAKILVVGVKEDAM